MSIISKSSDQSWYARWFNSPYYHLLYQYRDEAEARAFLDRLLDYLQPPPDSRLLDLGCGRGRYSHYLAERGYPVIGLDLSPANIDYARAQARGRASFYLHDMRRLFRANYFDFAFSFFTSFGFFERERDHLLALRQVQRGLRPGGTFILDYFNSRYVRRQLVTEGALEREGVQFTWQKHISDDHVHKKITVRDGARTLQFRENVRLYTLPDFQALFQQAGFRLLHYFGDYQLSPYLPDESPRLMLMAIRI